MSKKNRAALGNNLVNNDFGYVFITSLSVHLMPTSLNVRSSNRKLFPAEVSWVYCAFNSSIYPQHSRKSATTVIIYTTQLYGTVTFLFLCFTTQVTHCALTHLLGGHLRLKFAAMEPKRVSVHIETSLPAPSLIVKWYYSSDDQPNLKTSQHPR